MSKYSKMVKLNISNIPFIIFFNNGINKFLSKKKKRTLRFRHIAITK